MKIYLFDAWNLKFMKPVADHWRALGHEVKSGIYWGPDLVRWADLCYFYPVQNNLVRASKEQEKPDGLRVVAEAVDIDVYAGHWGNVNWAWVDALVVMAPHVLKLMTLPPELPVHVVPGGVDLDRFSPRRDPARNYDVAWVGNFWIAKNFFGALQVFNELIKRDPGNPWRLHVRSQKWSPTWWQRHCEAYLAANPGLAERVTFYPDWVLDIGEWLEDKAYLLSTSFKEAFGYAIAEAAAKGLRPVVQFTNGMGATWPKEWLFDTHYQAVDMFLDSTYEPESYRAVVADRYPLARRLEALDGICFT